MSVFLHSCTEVSPKSRCSVASPSENRALHKDEERLRSQSKSFLLGGKISALSKGLQIILLVIMNAKQKTGVLPSHVNLTGCIRKGSMGVALNKACN